MDSKILFIILCFLGSLLGGPVDFNEEGVLELQDKPLFVSLGSHCEVALTLRDQGLRHAAFPFDWLDSRNLYQVVRLLDDDFQYFTDAQYFIQLPEFSTPHTVFNTYYEIWFHHDWPFADHACDAMRYQQQLEAIEVKYRRRIERFRQLKNYPGKVYFIRALFWESGADVQQSAIQAMALRKALERYFPGLNFTLVIINYTDDQTPDIPVMEGVVDYKINRPAWKQEFALIYSLLKLF